MKEPKGVFAHDQIFLFRCQGKPENGFQIFREVGHARPIRSINHLMGDSSQVGKVFQKIMGWQAGDFQEDVFMHFCQKIRPVIPESPSTMNKQQLQPREIHGDIVEVERVAVF